jgi:hypothetical protein
MEATGPPARSGAVLALLSLALLAAAAAATLILAERDVPAGVAVVVAGTALATASQLVRGRLAPRRRFSISVSARLVDAGILGTLAWALLPGSPRAAAAAVTALSAAAVAAYLRVKGAGLGFRTRELTAVQPIRLAAVAVALLTPAGEAALWAAAAVGIAEAAGQAVGLAAQGEPA